jgi:phenylacetate-coenzyme A ligase PaaK-like adenylate-forming protein
MKRGTQVRIAMILPLAAALVPALSEAWAGWGGQRGSAMLRFRQTVDVAKAFGLQHVRSGRDRWTRAQLERFQQEKLQRLVAHAVVHSRFYADRLRQANAKRGFVLENVPPLTKAEMMANYDRLVTDPGLCLAEIEAHVQRAKGDALLLDEYRVLTTGGTSGMKGYFAYNRNEWITALAGAVGFGEMVGICPQFPRLRVCSIGGGNPMHASYRLAATLDVGLHNILRLEATAPIPELVRELNRFKPEIINAYPSILALLALEQQEGRLHIQPRALSTSSEVRTPEMFNRIYDAWRITPFDYYGMTEAAVTFGVDCRRHCGIHPLEDLFMFEVVDEHGRPVPPGTQGYQVSSPRRKEL